MRIAIALALAAFTVPAAAQTPPDSVVRLDSLTIRVTRHAGRLAGTPAAVSVVDGAELRAARPGLGLEEALGTVPGLFISNRQNQALGPRVMMRGVGARTAFGVRGIRVVSDGIPLTLPDGQTNLGNLDLLSAASIEVLRGPASAQWGNAAGGVLLVRTDVPARDGGSAEARMVLSDLGSEDDLTNQRRWALRADGRSGNVAWVASGSRLDQRGYRAHSAAEQNLFNGLVRIGGDAGALTVNFNVADAPVAQNPGSLPADSASMRPDAAWPNNVRTGSGESTRQIQGGVGWVGDFASGRLDAGLWGVTRTVDNPLPFGYIEVDRRAGGARAAWNGAVVDHVTITAGADLEHQRDARRELNNVAGSPGDELRRDQIDRVTTIAPFAQARVEIGDRTSISGGARWDHFDFAVADELLTDGDATGDRTLSAASGFLGVAFEPERGWTIWANASTSFQTPTTTELINAPPPAGTPCCPGGFNTDLDPQSARGVEAGVRAGRGRVSGELVGYAMRITDAIVPFQVAEIDGRTFFRNAAEASHRGVEAALTVTAAGITARGAYSWNRMTFEDDGDVDLDFEGNRVPGAPEHRLNIRASRPIGPLAVEVDLDHIGAYFADDANTAENDAATVLDLRLSADVATGAIRLSPFAVLLNATDTRYNGSVVVNAAGGRYYEPAPGRSLMLGLAVGTRW